MCVTETSGMVILNNAQPESVGDLAKEIEAYLSGCVDKIHKRVLDGSRSIFDFVDMAVLIGALAHITSPHGGKDTDLYISFVENEFVAAGEPKGRLIATATYCLMRCGLVHELSICEHNIAKNKQVAIDGYEISVTHDDSPSGTWYTIEPSKKELILHARELLKKIQDCMAICFDGKSHLWNAVSAKLSSQGGIRIIRVKETSRNQTTTPALPESAPGSRTSGRGA